MSYDIFYNKQFVKLRKTGEVIPMLLAGCNNCYEIAAGGRNGRRVRSWDSFRHYNRKGKLSEKPEIILDKLDAELRRMIRRHQGDKEAKPADIRDRFGYYAAIAVGGGICGDTSWNKWKSQFVNGIKGAMTIEELDNLGVNPYLDAFTGYNESSNGKPAPVNLRTEREYFTELKKWREWQGGNGKTFYLSLSPHDTDAVLRRLHSSNHKTPREKTRVEQDHYFTLTDGCYSLVKYTSRAYRYSYSKTGGKKFMTEKEAEKYRQSLITKMSYKAEIWKVERIDSSYTFLV